jgi:macrolide-specific efflux system membrane fusion protein
MNKKILFISIFVLLAVIGFFGLRALFSSDAVNADLTTVQIVKGDIENTVTATGTVIPKSFVDVGSQVSGQVVALRVDVGDTVQKGDLLAEIDTTVLETKVESSKAELAYQKAQLKDR